LLRAAGCQTNMVAGACYAQLLRPESSRCVFANVVIRHPRPSRGPDSWQVVRGQDSVITCCHPATAPRRICGGQCRQHAQSDRCTALCPQHAPCRVERHDGLAWGWATGVDRFRVLTRHPVLSAWSRCAQSDRLASGSSRTGRELRFRRFSAYSSECASAWVSQLRRPSWPSSRLRAAHPKRQLRSAHAPKRLPQSLSMPAAMRISARSR
jgi:hypothetical protein